jgi:hypothetical protein
MNRVRYSAGISWAFGDRPHTTLGALQHDSREVRSDDLDRPTLIGLRPGDPTRLSVDATPGRGRQRKKTSVTAANTGISTQALYSM